MLIINEKMLNKFQSKDFMKLRQELHETGNLTEEHFDTIENCLYKQKYLNNLRSSK